ncbi:MAG: acetamidase/formamidase family protein [Caldilineaceae bacterium]|nr:acetamidase/formamidase family protein [Caldilineaceae bacterium]
MQKFSDDSIIWDFAASLAPAYVVEPGEVFGVKTADALHGQVREGMTQKPAIQRANPATGPIAIQGVQPGQTLAVDILGIDLVGSGYLTFGGRPRFFKQQGGVIHFAPGVIMDIAPMIGTIGVVPATGSISTHIPGDHGGNMDTRDVARGATLYLTAQVDGGLLALGDVHALQGDGETSGQGIETEAEVTLRVRVLDAGLSARPYIYKDNALMVIVSAESLDIAAKQAVEEAAQLIQRHSELGYDEARMLLSLIGDLRVGQIVNPWKTMRMSFPLAAVPWRVPLPL